MYTIHKDQPQDDLGQTDTSGLTISIANNLGETQEKETLFHEITHAVFDLVGITKVLDGIDGDLEERVIRATSPAMFDVLTRPENASVFKHLFIR